MKEFDCVEVFRDTGDEFLEEWVGFGRAHDHGV